ncbi:MAG: PAS domain S-box protein, partial [Chloroflexota bacterium]
TESFRRLAGYYPDEIGSTLKLYHPDDAAAVREVLEKVIDGQAIDQEVRIITKTGELRWVHLRRRPVWDEAHEHVIRFYGVSQDITARKLVEEALQKAHDELEERVNLRTTELSQANQRLMQEIAERQQAQEALAAERNLLRTLIDNLPHAVYVKDRQARFAIANKAVADMMGVESPKEVIGRIDFDFHPEPLAQTFYAIEMNILETGQPMLNREETVFDADGQPKWLLTSKLPLWNSRGEITGLVGIGLDITERKRVEETLRRAHDELEQRVEERTAELRTANEEVRRFAYIVSHDLRAPLVNIKGFSSELRSALDVVEGIIKPRLDCLEDDHRVQLLQALDADVPEALGFISASVERMNNLINAILKLSRLGQRELQIDEVNTSELVQQIVKSLGHQIAERQATIIVGDLPTVSADPTALEQIFGNILNNAVLYLLPERPGQIEVSVERHARETVFHVRDNGQGIAASDHEKVFELFRRAGKPTVPGEGMGLAYVKTLVRRHEGRIWFDSELGTGTTFSFTIPHRITQET